MKEDFTKLLSDRERKIEFQKRWAKYPFKREKPDAWRYFRHTVNTKTKLYEFDLAFGKYMKSQEVKNGYCMKGGKWFKNWKEWLDEAVPGITPQTMEKKLKPVPEYLKIEGVTLSEENKGDQVTKGGDEFWLGEILALKENPPLVLVLFYGGDGVSEAKRWMKPSSLRWHIKESVKNEST